MNIKSWLQKTRNDPRRKLVIAEAHTSLAYLHQLAGKHRKGSPEFHIALCNASIKHTPDLMMTLDQMRPDIWGEPSAPTNHKASNPQVK